MRHAVTRNANLSQAVRYSSEVRFRNKGSKEAFRSATILAGNDALEQARTMAREFALTYGDLEFAIFAGGELIEEVEDPDETLHPHRPSPAA